MFHRIAAAGSTRPAGGTKPVKRDSETFRRLVHKEITTDDYVESLERRVRERHDEARPEHEEQRSKDGDSA